MRKELIALGTAALATGAVAAPKPFDPRDHRGPVAGRPAEVLVLGTPHLSGLPASFTPDRLAPLLDRLAAWRPDLIAIEALSGRQCDELRRYAPLHANVHANYCWDPAPAQKTTGLDLAAATLEAEKLLAAWPAAPTPAQRRRLAALFLAGGELSSALVQWLRLPDEERRAGDGLDAPLAKLLDRLRTNRNENYQIGAVLAARLGLERVYPVDDHTADGPVGNDPEYGKAVTRIWANPVSKRRRAEAEAAYARLDAPDATMTLYRAANAPKVAHEAFAGDFGPALRDATPKLYGRQYVGWWETRNLRMVGNMRAILATKPDARMLTIVGSSHKGYYDAYLGMMHDIRLADTARVLR